MSSAYLLDPATAELLWTLMVTGLLLLASGLSLTLLPWSDREIQKVHTSATLLLSSVVPPSTPLLPPRRATLRR